VFGGAAAVRLLYWALVTPDWTPEADADQYVQLARALADGDGFAMQFPQLEVHATAFRPPLLPIVLAPGAWLAGDALWPARLVVLLLGSVAVVLVGQYAARIGGRTAGWVAAGVMAVYPPVLANDTVTLTEPLALVLVFWALLALDERRWLPCALAAGLLVLVRPNAYLVVVVLAASLLVWVGWRRALAFAGVVVLVVLPWSVRNQVQVGTPRLTTSDGFTLAAIYAPQSQAAGHFVDPVYDPSFDDARFRWAQFDEAAWSAELSEVALEGVRDRPTYVLVTMRTNASAYFEIEPSRNRWAEENDGRDWGFRSAALPLYWLVTVAGLAGIATHLRDRRLWPLLAIVAQFVVVSLALVAPPRLRTPFDVLCCIGVGLLAAAVAERARARPPAGAPAIPVDSVS
jgi:4-amino-4-deoxy-L-arabinose transferase-like glycosyltransferase